MIDVPEQWLHVPGGPLKTQSYNKTMVDTFDQDYVLQSTYFRYMANVSMIEYVPARAGRLLVDLVHPLCPWIKNDDDLWVESAWCPLTGACEQFCISSLEMQPDWWVLPWHGHMVGGDYTAVVQGHGVGIRVGLPGQTQPFLQPGGDV